MFTEKHYFDHLSHQDLDAYLARGWYRMGQAIFTCRFLIFDGHLYSAIWVRLPLKGYNFRKSLRKVKSRVENRFRIEQGRATIDAEKEVLYQRYRREFPGRIASSLRLSLLDDSTQNLFDTREVRVYDDNKLVAFSFFDLGAKSIASILGVYDPEYAHYSLGFFTMIKEVEYALKKGKDFYYPGYVVPGYKRFDYKLRVGTVEYYNERLNSWNAYDELLHEDLPTERMHLQLLEAKQKLEQHGIPHKIVLYPPYEANLLGYWILDYLEFPLVLQCPAEPGHADRLVMVYNHLRQQYHVYHCSTYDDLSDIFLPHAEWTPDGHPYLMKLMIKEEKLIQSEDLDLVIKTIRDHPLLRGL